MRSLPPLFFSYISEKALDFFRFLKTSRKLDKLQKKYAIRSYDHDQMKKYISSYKKEKELELKKAKAIVEVAKKEMELTK